MKITLELHGTKYSVEEQGDDFSSAELKEMFSRLLVQATFPPGVIDLADGGHFECKFVEEEDGR